MRFKKILKKVSRMFQWSFVLQFCCCTDLIATTQAKGRLVLKCHAVSSQEILSELISHEVISSELIASGMIKSRVIASYQAAYPELGLRLSLAIIVFQIHFFSLVQYHWKVLTRKNNIIGNPKMVSSLQIQEYLNMLTSDNMLIFAALYISNNQGESNKIPTMVRCAL